MASPGYSEREQGGRAVLITFLFIAAVAVIFLVRHFWPGPADQLSGGNSADQGSLEGIRFWSADEVARRLKNNELLVFLDLRTPEAFAAEHILGSEWLALEALGDFQPAAGRVYVIVTDPTAPSAELRSIQEALGKKKANFAFLREGLSAWQRSGEATISAGNPNSFIDQSKVTFIAPEAADTLLRESDMLLLDVRDPALYANSHIPSAINIPLSALESRRRELPGGRPILVYGADELAGFQAGVRLFDMRFFGARVLEGGFARWQEKQLPVTRKGEQKSPSEGGAGQ